jgi:hypothetical protein
MNRQQLEILKTRIIISDPSDLVESTRIKYHPSLGKPDEVVWKYGFVLDSIKEQYNIRKII